MVEQEARSERMRKRDEGRASELVSKASFLRGSALRVAPQVERTRRRSSRGCGLAGRAASLTSVASVLLQHRYPNLATGLQRPLGHPHALGMAATESRLRRGRWAVEASCCISDWATTRLRLGHRHRVSPCFPARLARAGVAGLLGPSPAPEQ